MDYTKLKRLVQERGLTLKSVAHSIDLTEAGFHGMIKKNSLPINKLEAIASLLNVHIVELFGAEAPETDKEVVDLLRENRELNKKYNALLEKQGANQGGELSQIVANLKTAIASNRALGMQNKNILYLLHNLGALLTKKDIAFFQRMSNKIALDLEQESPHTDI